MEADNIYADAGVDYAVLDKAKRQAIAAAASTSAFAATQGVVSEDRSRGESAFVFSLNGLELAIVQECLGTKSALAAQYQAETGVNRFDAVGRDSVAAVVNDLISTGATPAVINAYFATGSPRWYQADGRFAALVSGWRAACEDAQVVWGGGESPMLGGVIAPDQIDIAGAAVGFFPPGHEPLLGHRLEPGDEIVLLASTGIHANGASLAREAALRGGGLSAVMDDGGIFGEAALAGSAIYSTAMSALHHAGVPLSYASHITGHGWRKLMRANRILTYRLHRLPAVPTCLAHIVNVLGMSSEQAYGTLNMGAGFALYSPAGTGADVVDILCAAGFDAIAAGNVEEGPRQVIVEPIDLVFRDDALQLR